MGARDWLTLLDSGLEPMPLMTIGIGPHLFTCRKLSEGWYFNIRFGKFCYFMSLLGPVLIYLNLVCFLQKMFCLKLLIHPHCESSDDPKGMSMKMITLSSNLVVNLILH